MLYYFIIVYFYNFYFLFLQVATALLVPGSTLTFWIRAVANYLKVVQLMETLKQGVWGGCAPQKLEGYTVIAGSFVAAF